MARCQNGVHLALNGEASNRLNNPPVTRREEILR